jgi:hypothetical protein
LGIVSGAAGHDQGGQTQLAGGFGNCLADIRVRGRR